MGLEILQGGFHFVQALASTTWTITHNLNTTEPAVDCWVDVSGDKTKLQPLTVTATSADVCTITFSGAESGEAFLT